MLSNQELIKQELPDEARKVALWRTKGNDFLLLYIFDTPRAYSYKGNGCGGGFFADNDEDAIRKMELPWGSPEGTGQVTVLKSDRPSVKRVD